MKLSIKDYFSKCDQIRSFLLIWSHLLEKSLIVQCDYISGNDTSINPSHPVYFRK